MGHSAERDAGLCTCPTPDRPTGREPEPLPPWECLTCGGYACEYAERGQKKCSPSICDCFIDQFPDSPRDLHPEVFIVSVALPTNPEHVPSGRCPDCPHRAGAHHHECTVADCGCDRSWDDFPTRLTPPAEPGADRG